MSGNICRETHTDRPYGGATSHPASQGISPCLYRYSPRRRSFCSTSWSACRSSCGPAIASREGDDAARRLASGGSGAVSVRRARACVYLGRGDADVRRRVDGSCKGVRYQPRDHTRTVVTGSEAAKRERQTCAIKGLPLGRPGSLIPVAALGLWRTSSIGLLLAAGIWAGIAPPALASIVAYNYYSATPDEGPLAGQKHSDIFSYDDLNPSKVQDFVAPLTFSFSQSGQTGYKRPMIRLQYRFATLLIGMIFILCTSQHSNTNIFSSMHRNTITSTLMCRLCRFLRHYRYSLPLCAGWPSSAGAEPPALPKPSGDLSEPSRPIDSARQGRAAARAQN